MKWIRVSQQGLIELLLIVILCLLFYILCVQIELAELFVEWLEEMEQYQFDEVVPTSIFALFCLSIFSLRRWKESQLNYIQRIQAQQTIEQLAFFDPLTGLPNRTLLQDRLDTAIARCVREESQLALLFFDLDGFKKINDSLGHEAGDRYLKELADRLKSKIRPMDTLSRMGGDEFVLLIKDCPSESDVLFVAERILDQVTQPIDLGLREVSTGASIGIAFYPQDGTDTHSLLKHADMAMYQAKAEGKHRYHFFSQELNTRVLHTLELESALEEALKQDRLQVVYQPQYDSETLQMTGVEALCRWPREDGPPIGPDVFIALAEGCGLIGPLGDWVLRRACRDAQPWGEIKLAVNLSPVQLKDRELKERVAYILAETNFPASRLELEITETSLLDDSEIARDTLKALTEMGIGISMDDFGTGYSSLTYIKQYPIQQLKVDRSFIQGLDASTSDYKLMKAIIKMSSALGIQTVAEGVETEPQMKLLREMGCQVLQGYLLSKPVSAETLNRMERTLSSDDFIAL